MKKIRNPIARAAHQRGGAHGKTRKAERRKTQVELHKLAAAARLFTTDKPGPAGFFYAIA